MNDVLPVNDAIEYVVGAYVFFLLVVLVYIGILGAKFQRISRDISELTDEVEAGKLGKAANPAPARVSGHSGDSRV